MKNAKYYTVIVALCVLAATLDSMHFPGVLRYLEMPGFSLCLVAFGVFFFEWGTLMLVGLLCGFLLDSGAAAPVHMAGFVLFALAGKFLSRFFYSNESVFHFAVQLSLLCVFEALFYIAEFYPFHTVAPRLELLLPVMLGNAAVLLPAVLLAPTAREKFTVYKL